MESVQYERRGDVAWLIVNRPAQRNALSADVVLRLRRGLAKAKADDEVRVVVLTGAGDGDFSAGGDLGEMHEEHDAFASHQKRSELNEIFRDLHELGKATIARVCGLALAGGFGLALGCDFIVAADDARFGLPEVRVGLWPYIITDAIMRAMPPRAALQLMLTGRRIDATEAMRLGFVTEVARRDELDDAIDRLTALLRAASPQATALGRTSFYRAMDADAAARLSMLEHALTVNLGLPDAAEGVAAFLERRAPRWAHTG